MERWEDSLLCSASLSQIFLHISTLDKCITWSKSALHARCRICRRKGDAEKMLLCDGCDRGHHMYCLKPPVEKVPSGDWYCPICRPKETKRSPRKDRRKTFTEESEEENDESDEEDDEEDDSSEEDSEEDLEDSDEDEDSEEELDPNDNTCTKCNKTGMLLCCDNCPGSYHLHCAVPPLKKVPRGKWMCPVCLGTENKGKIKIGKVSNTKKKKTPAKTTPNSSRPGSRRESPRDSPVPSRSSRKTNHDSDDDTPRSRKSNKSSSKQSHDFYQDMEGTPKQYVSSFRCNTQVQQMKAMEDIVNDLVKQEDSWPFLKPVVKKEVPDYYEVITKPMDFSTIRNKIHKFEYSEPSQLISDVRQIFMNCIEYNNRKTPQYKAGGNLSKIFENKIRDLGIDTQETTPPPSKKSKRS